MKQLKKCLICKNVFDRPLRTVKYKFKISWNEYKRRKFCSPKCRGINQSQTYRGDKVPNWKGGKTKCVDCGVELAARYTTRNTTRCRSCWKKFAIGENHHL